ncbi:MAG: Two-component response regulator, CheY subfamily [candidate division CPR2 bacterium GW2011_GWC1_39_9]|uniref:Two-component response regulator, CheY subfamily n=1 Tax=candidate division CPR2 bacterium GW2011_GWC2_39_10 TaxID=1618345 RepID=A0A0G0PBD6_UNCC2|nr:MAG: Two-component response regulator, CheY subfamily [candidate division CPR2 bacterium GW2011_GWC2_39_10]KKR36210.1 MAG: Two-component response regulator, CheY subfamily [candidate division CPR2 bacterium GW2011_GWC1_39_9]
MAQKILLCEDSVFFAQAISTLLKTQGYEVTAAPDGEQGLKVLKEQPDFNLILCDIMMPNVDGFGVIREVRMDPELRKIPFIFLTGVSDQESMDKAGELGVADYFIKSNVGLDKIIDLVKKHISFN